MRKNLLNKLLVICTISILCLFQNCIAQEEAQIPVKNENNVQELTTDVKKEVKVNDLDIEPLNTNKLKKEVVPDTKKEGQKVIQYFLKVMSSVIVCAILLFFILLFVKKFYGSAFISREEDEYEALSLSSPETKEDALKSFINRTR